MSTKPIQLKIIGKIELPVERKRVLKDQNMKKAEGLLGSHNQVRKARGMYHSKGKFYDNTETVEEYKKLRAKLYIAYQGLCCYCECKTRLVDPGMTSLEDDHATIEHVYTRNDIRRLLANEVKLSCYRCNVDKGNRDFREHKMKNHAPSAEGFNLIAASNLQLSTWQKIKYWWKSLKCKICVKK